MRCPYCLLLQGAGQVGPIIDVAGKERCIKYISEAEANGATILLDGRSWCDRSPGNWVRMRVYKCALYYFCLADHCGAVLASAGNPSRSLSLSAANCDRCLPHPAPAPMLPTPAQIGPTVILHRSKEDRAMHDEIFGPVISVYVVSSWAEAIAIENGNPYGNAASIYTTVGGNAEWFTSRFRAGMIGVNIGIPVPREPFSFGGLYPSPSKYGDLDITGTLLWSLCRPHISQMHRRMLAQPMPHVHLSRAHVLLAATGN